MEMEIEFTKSEVMDIITHLVMTGEGEEGRGLNTHCPHPVAQSEINFRGKRVIFSFNPEQGDSIEMDDITIPVSGTEDIWKTIQNNIMSFEWIIGICNSEADGGAKLYRFKGTKEETKRELFRLILEDVQTAFLAVETRDYGTESFEEISEDNETGELYGYSVFHDYHIDYSAKKFSCIKEV